MTTIPLEYGLLFAAILFLIGLTGALVRKNLIFLFLSIEIMINAAGLAFIVAGANWAQPDGQVMFLFILSMAATEVSIGLALILRLHHRYQSLDSDTADNMKG